MVMTRAQMLAQALQNNTSYNMGNSMLQQGMGQAYSPGQAIGNALTTYAGFMGRNKGQKQAEQKADSQSQQLAKLLTSSGINVPQGQDPADVMQLAMFKKQLAPDPVDTFEVVDNPYGKGGFGQKNARTGQIVGYQPPEKQPAETWGNTMEVSGPDGNPMLVQVSNKGNMRPVEGYGPKPGKPNNPFGNNATGNLLNVLNTYPPDSQEYRMAYVAYGQPKTSFDPTTGQATSITPDMSAFTPPPGVGGNPDIRQAGGMPGASGATVQTVTQPKAPTGFRYKDDGTLEPIPGGPQAQEAEDILQSRREGIAGTERMIRTIDSLLTHPGREAATGMSYMLSSIPGTEAKNFASTLETLKSQAFLPMVQSLKGMGQLSNAEGEKLTAAIGALDPEMTEEAFVQSLNTIKADFQNALSRMQGGQPHPTSLNTPNAGVQPKQGQVQYGGETYDLEEVRQIARQKGLVD